MAEFKDESADELWQEFKLQYEIFEKTGSGSEILGEGTYGKVYKARKVSTGEVVALKESKDVSDEGVPSTAIREVALVKELSHPNVVRLLDVFCSTKKLVLVFEFCEHDLKKYMRSLGKPLDRGAIRSFSRQLCDGMQFCHAHRILHRDMKPQNLLIDSRLCMKIADFGLARSYSVPVPSYTPEVVTVGYRPPEILLGCTHYSCPVDMWGVACIIAEMATGMPLFVGDSEIDTIFKIFQKLGTPTVEEWPGLTDLPLFKTSFPKWKHKGWENIRTTKAQVGDDGIDLLEKLMTYDPKRRTSARTAMQHRYLVGTELLK